MTIQEIMMSDLWHYLVIIIVILHIVAYLWLLFATAKKKVPANEKNDTGHVWDEDITELNNPLPRWWLWLFILTIVFAVIYLYRYPGMGNYAGSLNWTQQQQFLEKHTELQAARNASYQAFIDKPIEQMIKDDEAMLIGQRIFKANCSQCHGSDAKGAPSYPNLVDDDWLYGGDYQQIYTSITQGRNGIMPIFANMLQEEGVVQVAAYVRNLNDKSHLPLLAKQGKSKFDMFCASCHGAEAKGNILLGAPDLTDDIWLHGNSDVIETALYEGFNNKMPTHKELLDANSLKIVAAYIYSLNQK